MSFPNVADQQLWPSRFLAAIWDFSLKFEDVVLDIVPAASWAILTPAIHYCYVNKPVYASHSPVLWLKLLLSALLLFLEIATVAIRCAVPAYHTNITAAAAAVDIVSAVGIITVVYVEHRRGIRASALLSVYLTMGILIDGTRTRSYFIRDMSTLGGSGKTTIFESIIGENQILDGIVYVDEMSIALCGQQLWLTNGTIRECIIGGFEYDHAWYLAVITACELVFDINQFEERNDYLIGSDGIRLSGGQRQRLCIARAVYARASIVLLDDSFSALDMRTARAILHNLCNRENGLLRQSNCAVLLTNYVPESLQIADELLHLKENGVLSQMPITQIDGDSMAFVEALLASANRAPREEEEGPRSPQWDSDFESDSELEGQSPSYAPQATAAQLQPDETTRNPGSRQKGNKNIYWLWMNQVGRQRLAWWFVIVLVMCLAEGFPTIYMKWWIELSPANKIWFIGYALLSLTAGLLGGPCVFLMMIKLSPRASIELHGMLTGIVMRCTIGFLGATDSGSILNRYSVDMDLIAKQIPAGVYNNLYLGITTLIQDSSTENSSGLSFLVLIVLGTSFNRAIMTWTTLETALGSLSRLLFFFEDTPVESANNKSLTLPDHWPSQGQVQIHNLTARYICDTERYRQTPVLRNITLSVEPGQKVGIMGRTGSGKSSLLMTLLGFLDYEGSIYVDGVDLRTVSRDELRSRIITISQDQVELDGTIRDNLLPFDKTWTVGKGSSATTAPSDEVAEKDRQEAHDRILKETLIQLGLWESLVGDAENRLDIPLAATGFSHGETQLMCIARAVVRRRIHGGRLVLVDESTGGVDMWRDRIVREMMRDHFRDCTILIVAHRAESIADSHVS
ncbi:ABC transporter [Cordyceps javanica]|uniref:ABC transporter n=1 Tax=Cordyceps javanica TaxID=43265 RepID=A0A545VIH6_9HYPO|nr:ABC transporter [Cordyceps javanica]TQW01534.1 ABC transporter [Cordyceps javanica]